MIPHSHQKAGSQPASYILSLLVGALALIANLPSIFAHVVILEVRASTRVVIQSAAHRDKSREWNVSKQKLT